MGRQADMWTGGQPGRMTDRKTERQKDRKTERQKDRKTERQKDRRQKCIINDFMKRPFFDKNKRKKVPDQGRSCHVKHIKTVN